MQLQSKSLNRSFDFVTFEREENGRVIKIIMHDSLEDVIHNQATGIRYKFEIVSSDRAHSIVKCIMFNDDNTRYIEAVGESIPETLDNQIAQNYPTLIASQRAFDRAAIRFLNLPGKVLSNTEIPFIEDIVDDAFVAESVPTEPTKASGGIVSSVVEDDNTDNISINTGMEIEDIVENVDTEVVIDDSESVESAESTENIIVDDSKEEEIIVTEDVSDDSLPFDVETEEVEESVGNYVITMNGKYATAGKTIDEIYKTDANWIEWIAANFVPHNPVAEKDVAQIKKFVASKRGA